MSCTYCAQPITGNYCSHCGQRAISRFNWEMAMTWLRDELFVLDRGFFYTIKELVLHPVTLINNYLAGSTKRYFNPFKLLIILSTGPIALILFFSDDIGADFGKVMREGPPPFTAKSFWYLIDQWSLLMLPNLVYHVTITTILLAAACKQLFRKRGLNYLEHLIVICFIACFMLLLNYCTIPIWAFAIKSTPTTLLFSLTLAWILIGTYLVVVFKKIHLGTFVGTILRGVASVYGAMIPSMLIQLVILSLIKFIWELIINP